VYVKFSFDDSVQSKKYKYQMRFEALGDDDWTKEDDLQYFDSKGQQSITISIAHLARMKNLVVGCSTTGTDTNDGEKEQCQFVRTGLRKVTRGFLYGHNFGISLKKRRRLAETPKPLGWKPSHDMDWSSEYRQRRR